MFGLSFLFPAFLAGAAAAAVPIVLHLLKRQPEPKLLFPAVRFLKHTPIEQSRRRRVRDLLLLASRVSALLLLAFAFARPYLLRGLVGSSTPITIVMVDVSFSMSAPSQFDRAIRLARDAIAASPASDAVGVIAFADEAEVIVPPGASRSAATAAVEVLQPGFGATRYRAALARAAQVVGPRPGRVVVITDLQRSGWETGDEGVIPARISVEVRDVGPPRGNLAVTAVHREGSGLMAAVRNTASFPQTSRAALSIDGRPLAATEFTVAPGVSTDVQFTAMLPRTGVASVSITDQLGYRADNTRYLVLDPSAVPSVLAIASGDIAADGFYLEHALLAAADAARFRVTTMTSGAFGRLVPTELSAYSGILLLGTRGLERRARETLVTFVKGGGGLFIVAGPDLDAEVVTGMFSGEAPVQRPAAVSANLSFAPADLRHPVFRVFGGTGAPLSRVQFQRTLRLEVPPGARVIARFSDGSPALLEMALGAGRVLEFASDLNNRWNDFPLHPSFVPFVQEVAGYLTTREENPLEYLTADVPAGVSPTPGTVLPAQRESRSMTTGAGGGQPGRAVVNVDPRESDPSPITAAEFAAAITRLNEVAAGEAISGARQQEEQQRLWQYAFLCMLICLIGESLLGRRAA